MGATLIQMNGHALAGLPKRDQAKKLKGAANAERVLSFENAQYFSMSDSQENPVHSNRSDDSSTDSDRNNSSSMSHTTASKSINRVVTKSFFAGSPVRCKKCGAGLELDDEVGLSAHANRCLVVSPLFAGKAQATDQNPNSSKVVRRKLLDDDDYVESDASGGKGQRRPSHSRHFDSGAL